MDLTGRIPPLRHVRYFLEYLVLRTLFALFGLLSLDNASAVGGYLGARIGPKLPISRRAVSNLKAAFPDWENVEVSETVRSMWDHLGRMAGEYPHLRSFNFCDDDDRIEIIGSEYIDQLRDDGMSGIFFSAHLGNWELLPVAASKRGLPLVHVYRAANNPYVENLIKNLRSPIGSRHYPKSRRGAKMLLETVDKGGHLGLLVDQKYNEGIPIPFFGRDAMTVTTPADLALRFNIPLVPVRIERTTGACFRLTISPPLSLPKDCDNKANSRAIMTEINSLFESWIRERPEQWYWLHRRWPNN